MAKTEAEWSLGRQSALWFGGMLALLALVLVAFVYLATLFYVAQWLDEELGEIESLAIKTLDGQDPGRSQEFLTLIAEENDQVAVWIELRQGDAATVVGDASLRDVAMNRFRRRATRTLEDGRALTIVIDGQQWRRPMSRFRLAIALMAIPFAIVVLVASWFFGRKVSALLRAVSRSVEDHGRPSIPRGAPREIADVTRAVAAEFDKLETQRLRVQLLIAGAAHELRSPVQSMLSRVQVTLRRSPPKQIETMLAGQEQELVDLARKVDNLVLLSAEAQDRLPMESFDWSSELQLRLGSDVRRAQQHGVTVTFGGPPSLLIEGNRETLMLAVRNLLSNAVRFSQSGQRVRVGSEVDEHGLVTVTVDDEGPGVPVADREAVFETLRRGQQGQRGGYGLGLALVRRAMLDHMGRAWVSDAPSGGARFVLQFPAVGGAASTAG